MSDNEQSDNEQTERPKPHDPRHTESADHAGQSAESIPDGSGTNTGGADDTERDTASGGPAD